MVTDLKPSYSGLARAFATIAYGAATILIASVAVALLLLLYTAAYVFVPLGVLLIIYGIGTASIAGVLIGLLYAGVGGVAYLEWFESDLPTLSEIARRIAHSI